MRGAANERAAIRRQLQGGSNWALYTGAQLTATGLACIPADAFTAISFDHTRMVRSNLGGQGGRCRDTTYSDGTSVAWSDVCEERCDALVCTSPPEIYLGNVGVDPSGFCIDLRITNETEYRANNANVNGVKRELYGTTEGFFGVLNLLGPRRPWQRPYYKFCACLARRRWNARREHGCTLMPAPSPMQCC